MIALKVSGLARFDDLFVICANRQNKCTAILTFGTFIKRKCTTLLVVVTALQQKCTTFLVEEHALQHKFTS